MDIAIGAAALSIITLVIGLLLAARNKQKTEERKKDAGIPPRSLAKGGNSHKPVD